MSYTHDSTSFGCCMHVLTDKDNRTYESAESLTMWCKYPVCEFRWKTLETNIIELFLVDLWLFDCRWSGDSSNRQHGGVSVLTYRLSNQRSCQMKTTKNATCSFWDLRWKIEFRCWIVTGVKHYQWNLYRANGVELGNFDSYQSILNATPKWNKGPDIPMEALRCATFQRFLYVHMSISNPDRDFVSLWYSDLKAYVELRNADSGPRAVNIFQASALCWGASPRSFALFLRTI